MKVYIYNVQIFSLYIHTNLEMNCLLKYAYIYMLSNNPERRDYDVAKMGFKTGAGKT